MKNITDQEVVLEVGERVVQAVFAPFLIADGDEGGWRADRWIWVNRALR